MTLETEGVLTDEQYERLEQKWMEKFQGIKNAHRPALLEGGLKANVLSQSNRDMDFNEGKREVCLGYHRGCESSQR
jgi:phage portal protein BeeE